MKNDPVMAPHFCAHLSARINLIFALLLILTPPPQLYLPLPFAGLRVKQGLSMAWTRHPLYAPGWVEIPDGHSHQDGVGEVVHYRKAEMMWPWMLVGTNNHQENNNREVVYKDFLLTRSQTTHLSIHARYPKPLVWASGSSSVDPGPVASVPPWCLSEMQLLSLDPGFWIRNCEILMHVDVWDLVSHSGW